MNITITFDPAIYKLVPIEPDSAMILSMAASKARDDDGEFQALVDLIDFSAENKTRTILKAAYAAMIAAVPEPLSTYPAPDAIAIIDACKEKAYQQIRLRIGGPPCGDIIRAIRALDSQQILNGLKP